MPIRARCLSALVFGGIASATSLIIEGVTIRPGFTRGADDHTVPSKLMMPDPPSYEYYLMGGRMVRLKLTILSRDKELV